jgi:hypothetical protein
VENILMAKDNPDAKKKKFGGKQEGCGRKSFVFSDAERARVQKLSGDGLPYDQIAALIGIDKETLAKHFRKDILLGQAIANEEVGSQFKRDAMSGEQPGMAIWWTKSRMGWRESKEPTEESDSNKLLIEMMKAMVDKLPD